MNRHHSREEKKRPGFLKPGQDLIVAGSIGLTGAAAAARAGEKALRERFSASYAERLLSLDKDAENFAQNRLGEAFFREAGVTEAEPAEDGGIMNSLWNLLEAYGLGCTIELRAIPILQETVEVCEVFDINPYRLSSGGCLLMAADNGFSALNALRKRGVEGAVIGKVEKGIARRILNGETETFLDRPKPDEIEKILNQREVKL